MASHKVITMFLTNGEAVFDGLSMSEQAESDKEKEEGIDAGEVHVVDVERVAQGGKGLRLRVLEGGTQCPGADR